MINILYTMSFLFTCNYFLRLLLRTRLPGSKCDPICAYLSNCGQAAHAVFASVPSSEKWAY